MNINGNVQKIMITGGAGFIGTNLANALMSSGYDVIIFDNLSRAGSEKNLQWLLETHKNKIVTKIADIRDIGAIKDALNGVSHVFHLAAQVAVTKSLEFPTVDFAINLQGTLNLLECIRACKDKPTILYTSTNKVFGSLHNIPLSICNKRYETINDSILKEGINSNTPLGFCTPYGCSKGGAEQYILDYSRNYGIPAVVFRMSCIYGPHQFGNEDQGWVAHFLIRAIDGLPITIYGDGLQVRDILFVDDLIQAMKFAVNALPNVSGQAFSIGGGPANTISLIELLDHIQTLHGKLPQVCFAPWRAGDQKYYVSNIAKFSQLTQWKPAVDVFKGITILYEWLKNNHISNVTNQTDIIHSIPES